ncbi:M20/M25/M40 family metallo-hydrolase [Sphingomonas baiyangensis]|uniref:M20/M25/M40 family metallo-hydrolase n=1 Tax=Sphingomonas baiyangensis TaxID=2572576 RepID=A0A4U1L695_9SPHN|nr:M20/M25/M40 family metallo-hydrolase [Sphingomonas baiyangensis]
MARAIAGLAAAALLAAGARADDRPLGADAAAVRAHVAVLADDALKGRAAGTPEYEKAADYVIAQMAAAGLSPAGTNGDWRQPVTLVAARATGGEGSLLRGSRATRLVPGHDVALLPHWEMAERKTEGEVVFAGHGVIDPARGVDDYRGLDVKGRIVAILLGTPNGLEDDVAAHYGNRDVRAELAARNGAVGILFIEDAGREAFAATARAATGPRVRWAPPAGGGAAPIPQLAVLGEAGAAKLFAGSPIAWAKVRAAERARTALPTGALGRTARFRQLSEQARIASNNVVGRLAGSDPALAGEHVVLTAHLDHVGVGEPVAGDAIHNGAVDNAIGVGAMIEVARRFQREGRRPRRSLLFVALTAEEAGLLGSDYFANHPTVPREGLVANVNIDMPILTYAFQDIVAFGAGRSSIGPVLARVAKAQGIAVTADPQPEEAFFVRSDHYSFVRAGIPSVAIDTGPAGPGAAATAVFLERHYHQPSDEIGLPIDWDAADRFVMLHHALVAELADGPRPKWNAGDYFGTVYGRQ